MANLLAGVRRALAANKFVFVPGADVLEILSSLSGGKALDRSAIAGMSAVWAGAIPQADPETAQPIYPFKNTLLAHYAMDSQAPACDVRRFHGYDYATEGTPHEKPGASFVAEVIDTTTVHEDGIPFVRVHKTFEDAWESNPTVQALQRFIWEVMFGGSEGGLRWDDPADGTVKDSPVFHMQMAAYRILSNKKRFGEPGPEGVHQDTAEMTAIMLLKRENLQPESGWNRVWTLDQPNGKVGAVPAGSTAGEEGGHGHRANLLTHTVLSSQFDTLLVLDRDVKHEALPIRPVDPALDAVRDVLTFEVRRPWVVGQQAKL
jgi:hypothetical protein